MVCGDYVDNTRIEGILIEEEVILRRCLKSKQFEPKDIIKSFECNEDFHPTKPFKLG